MHVNCLSQISWTPSIFISNKQPTVEEKRITKYTHSVTYSALLSSLQILATRLQRSIWIAKLPSLATRSSTFLIFLRTQDMTQTAHAQKTNANAYSQRNARGSLSQTLVTPEMAYWRTDERSVCHKRFPRCERVPKAITNQPPISIYSSGNTPPSFTSASSVLGFIQAKRATCHRFSPGLERRPPKSRDHYYTSVDL